MAVNKQKFLFLSTICITAILVLYAFFAYMDINLVSGLISAAVLLGVSMVIFKMSRIFKYNSRDWWIWTFFTIGMLFWFFGELIWFYYEIIRSVAPFPSVGDVFFVVGYIFFIAGALTYFIILKNIISTKELLFPTFSFIIILVLISKILLFPILIDADYFILNKMFSVSYILLDIVIIAFGLVLMKYVTRLWGVVIMGFLIITVADMIFAYIDYFGVYASHNILLNSLWLLGYLLLGAAAIKQRTIFLNRKAV